MKAHQIAIAVVASGLIGLSGLVNAETTVYGKANISLNKQEADSNSTTVEDTWKLNSNASRLGVKGSKELDDGIEAIYQLEYEVALDDGEHGVKVSVDADCDNDDATPADSCSGSGTGSSFKQRNIFVGLKGSLGQIIAGKHDTPTKKAQGKIDRFNDLPLGDIKNVLSGGENRESNILIYTSPDMSGFELNVGFIPGEQDGTAGNDENGLADSSSVSLKYSGFENFWIALASDSEVDDMDISRAAAEYSFEQAKLGLIIQSGEEVSSGVESSGYVVSGAYDLGDKLTLKAQYGSDTQEPAAGDIETSIATLGLDIGLGNKAKVYVYTSSWDEEDTATGNEEDATTFGLGTEVKF